MVIVVDVEDSDAEENCCVMVEHNEEELWLRAKRIAGIAGPADDDRNPAKKRKSGSTQLEHFWTGSKRNYETSASTAKCSLKPDSAAEPGQNSLTQDAFASDDGTNKSSFGAFALKRIGDHPITWRSDGRERLLQDCELLELAPSTIKRKALPADLADALLAQLLPESKSDWKSGDWVVYGQKHTLPRSTAMYWLHDEKKHKKESSHPVLKTSPEICAAASCIADIVAVERPKSNWKPNLAIGNRYDSGSNCVGWHSDMLNDLGPRPIIAGLSLGATRQFRLKRVSSGEGSEADGAVLSIPMPHNTVVVMWDDCQEAWHHAVPRQSDSSVGRHPKAGLVRLSLTFRFARADLTSGERLKMCHCNRRCGLKSKGGRYYMSCHPAGASEMCGFWEPCPWAQEEADRMRIDSETERANRNFDSDSAISGHVS